MFYNSVGSVFSSVHLGKRPFLEIWRTLGWWFTATVPAKRCSFWKMVLWFISAQKTVVVAVESCNYNVNLHLLISRDVHVKKMFKLGKSVANPGFMWCRRCLKQLSSFNLVISTSSFSHRDSSGTHLRNLALVFTAIVRTNEDLSSTWYSGSLQIKNIGHFSTWSISKDVPCGRTWQKSIVTF